MGQAMKGATQYWEFISVACLQCPKNLPLKSEKREPQQVKEELFELGVFFVDPPNSLKHLALFQHRRFPSDDIAVHVARHDK